MGEYIKIEGIIENHNNVSYESLMDNFLLWLENNGCYFGGGYYLVDENGDPIE